MAAGYIIARKNDSGTTTGYWDGTAFTADAAGDAIDSADFVETRGNARFVQGSIQAANVDVDVVYLAAESNISLS